MNAKTYDDLIKQLRQQGSRLVGRGLYAKVFSHPTNKKVVIKVAADDKGYGAYVKWALKRQGNPLVPIIFDHKRLTIEDIIVTVTTIEKLKPIQDRFFGHALASEFLFDEIEEALDERRYLYKLLPDYSSSVLKFLYRNSDMLDLHSGNVMLRGKQLVITDPFASY